jgi:NhaA family Na+:H+ antiporter
MSLFISGLAFGESPSLTAAKVGILLASLLAGLVGWLILRNTLQSQAS